MPSQRLRSVEASKHTIRKRTCKACDRCRLRKSKCDGASPCSRCRANNAICFFGERKKSQDKVYPKGYIELLEQQQAQLVAGLQVLYNRLQSGQGWPGPPLCEPQGGHPSTHDILERLDLLCPSNDSSSDYEVFEVDCNRMQQKLLERGVQYTHQRVSISSESDHGHASRSPYGDRLTTKSLLYNYPFAQNHSPPTTPMNSPSSRDSLIAPPIKQEAPVVLPSIMNTGALGPSALSQSARTTELVIMEEPLDFNAKLMYGFDTSNNFDCSAMVPDPFVVNLTGTMFPD
ncbi:hypothetical protein DM02DRAFT_722328 [Periconia macrospinosa]|uniref:Zn(2)-C6 fungal-type domain-containing protein n=1 Tax=Periconia macrospinosa TaxID=97972 RepID=A0A2V1D0X6_9PLEO|nr:hypothetical protein DM02DRAFT_722328 [Periconia macrospinosa]